jgi:Polyketide cyclase / dehydrase and lipid transport
MAQQVIDHTATTTGSPGTVFALLADGSTWPTWSPLGSFTLLEPGEGTPEGLGALRKFTTGRHSSTERVVTVQADQVFSYTLVSGMPIRDYQAVVTLTPLEGGGGTSIRWRSTFRAKVPLTGSIYRRALGGFIGRTVEGLARAASSAPVAGADDATSDVG